MIRYLHLVFLPTGLYTTSVNIVNLIRETFALLRSASNNEAVGLGALYFVFSPSFLNAAPVGGQCLGSDVCTRDADYGSYGDYGSYQPPTNG
jgi:hypothetical protein